MCDINKSTEVEDFLLLVLLNILKMPYVNINFGYYELL